MAQWIACMVFALIWLVTALITLSTGDRGIPFYGTLIIANVYIAATFIIGVCMNTREKK